MAAQYLVADAYTGSPPVGSYVYKLLNPNAGIPSPIYVGADVYFCAELIFELKNDPNFPFIDFTWQLFGVFNLYGAWGGLTPTTAPADYYSLVSPNGPYLNQNVPSNPQVNDWYWGDVGGAAVGTGLHTIQFHADVGAQIFEYRVDGTVYPFVYDPVTMDTQFAEFDALVAGWGGSPGTYPPDITNITNITLGTTGWGSTDIFGDDFSSGDLSAWDGFVGNCSVSAAPVCPAGPLPPPPPTITSSPYFSTDCSTYIEIDGTDFNSATQLSFSETGVYSDWFAADDNTIFFNSGSGGIPVGYPTVTGPDGSATSTTYYWGCGSAASGFAFDASVGFRAET